MKNQLTQLDGGGPPLMPVLERQRQADLFGSQGQTGLCSEFQDSQIYSEILSPKTQNKNETKQKKKKKTQKLPLHKFLEQCAG